MADQVARPVRQMIGVAVAAAETDNAYLTLCAVCGVVVRLSDKQAVLAEARAVIGDLTIVFCGGCIRAAAARMVDELGG